MLDLTAWQVASLPFWALALWNLLRIVIPSKGFEIGTGKYGINVALSLLFSGIFAYIAARLWS